MNSNKKESLELIRECLIDYSVPLYIIGDYKELNLNTDNEVSVKNSKNNFIILNNNYPEWVRKVYNNSGSLFNLLILKDFDKLNEEEQNMFVDIICYNQISSENLPEDLKIIITSEKECKLIPKIREMVQMIKL